MNKRILISGGNGRFATHLISQANKFDIISPSHDEMDITSVQDIDTFITTHKPDYFIHAAALTRPLNLHKKTPTKSIIANIIGTSNVVLSCIK